MFLFEMGHWWLLLLLVVESSWGFTGRGLMYPGNHDFFELSIIHINDFHARFEETGPTSGTCYPHEKAKKNCYGGIARVYTAVKQLKDERPNAIFLNAGDHFQGTMWYNVHRWNATAVFLNKLPHDAMTIGNHDFDDNVAGLVPFLKRVNTTVVVANIDDSQEPSIQNLYQNSTIIERDGRKIGIIGVILSTTNTISATGKLSFYDEVRTINEESKKLKNQGIDIIIVLSHVGLDVDKIIAAKCPLVDVIVGGHSHSFLYSGPVPANDQPEDEYPVVVKQSRRRNVLIVQAAAYTKYVGNLTVWFDKAGEVADWEGNPILMDSSIEQDPEIVKELIPWKQEVDQMAKKVLGQTRVHLDNSCRVAECNLGNLITDAMVDSYVEQAENETFWTYAAVSCQNVGGIRTDIAKESPNITYGDLMTAFPFENTWDTVEVQGSTIRELLEMGVLTSYSKDKFIGRGLLMWSGIKVVYNLTAEPYHRVKEMEIRCRACEIPRFEPVVPHAWYRLVVPSFLMHGGDGYTIFETKGKNHRVGPKEIDPLVNYVTKQSPLKKGTDRRMIFLGQWRGQ
ncbi:apyrase-like isoform X2 [Prorops nasuta]|uniref:apyrase-like isoform X2 n=1 Tax=Prorops nasuta TaxID=863751 RepID=UPI0034CDC7AF